MKLTDEILLERKKGIGGSECAAVLGASQYRTPLKVYLDKTSEEVDFFGNDATEIGSALESFVISKYEKHTHVKCIEPSGIIRNPKYKWLLANIDAWIDGKPSILEAKTTGEFHSKWGDAGTDEIPYEYLLQCAHYCIVCDAEKKIDYVDIAALSRKTGELRIYRYDRNKELEELIIEKTHDFWYDNVLKGLAPEPTNSSDIALIYKTINNSEPILATNDMCQVVDELLSVRGRTKVLKEQGAALRDKIELYMLDKGILINAAGELMITWKESKKKKSLDTEKLKAEQYEIYDKYLKEGEKAARPFLVKQ